MKNLNGLRHHLESNYEYAKKIETAIEAQRKKVANDMLAMKDRLTTVEKKKSSL